jgi:nitronate monooxygenase
MLATRLPIVQAPMGGGPSTPELAAAVANAGGLGSLAAAYLSPAQITAAIGEVRARTDRPFSVNLFVAGTPALVQDPAPMLALLAPFHEEMGLPAPVLPERPAERFADQAAAVLASRVPLFSFTFGIPEPELLAAFRAAGTSVVGTATTVREAVALAAAGVDGIIAQGAEAGGHRGTFMGRFEEALVPAAELLRSIVAVVSLPVVAAGGIRDGQGVAAALRAGAAAAALGTAFIPCPESGAPAAHKAAVLAMAPGQTVVTRALSGRPARGLPNRLIAEIERADGAILPFPWQNAATAPLRKAAAQAGRADLSTLWAGDGALPLGRRPAGELVAALARDAGLRG